MHLAQGVGDSRAMLETVNPLTPTSDVMKFRPSPRPSHCRISARVSPLIVGTCQ
jgi:hypothetical protein